jgi:hypothetical protein
MIEHFVSDSWMTDDDSGGGIEASSTFSFSSGSLIRVLVLSYDGEFAGTTDVVLEAGGTELQRVNSVNFGSEILPMAWSEGDTALTTGHYERETLRDTCEDTLDGEYEEPFQNCVSPYVGGSGVVQAEGMCNLANSLASRDHDKPLKWKGVYTYGRGCEYSNVAKHTVLMAVEDWTKSDWLLSGYEPCGTFGLCPVYRQRNTHATAVNGLDNDAAHYGNNAKIDFPADSVSQVGDNEPTSGVVVALHPWNDFFAAYDGSYDESRSPSDLIRFYKDEVGPVLDNDEDGLSNQLEAQAGTDPDDNDSDGDGAIDALELYGHESFPLPDLGASPSTKTFFAEVDRVDDEFTEYDAVRNRVISFSVEAFDEASVDFLPLIGSSGEGGALVDRALFTPPNTNAVIPASQVDPNSSSESVDHDVLDGPLFDLKSFPFMRRVVFYAADLDPDQGAVRGGYAPANGAYGRWAKVYALGRVFLHEYGHTLGLKHGGDDDITYKPNYWSAMNYARFFWRINPNGGGSDAFYIRTQRTDRTDGGGTGSHAPFAFSHDDDFLVLDEQCLTENDGLKGRDQNGDIIPMTYEDAKLTQLSFQDSVSLTFLDWDGDGSFNESCIQGNTRQPCRDNDPNPNIPPCDFSDLERSLTPFDDIQYLQNLETRSWSQCSFRDAQRSMVGLPILEYCYSFIPLSSSEPYKCFNE